MANAHVIEPKRRQMLKVAGSPNLSCGNVTFLLNSNLVPLSPETIEQRKQLRLSARFQARFDRGILPTNHLIAS
ncbi:hypothetical protein MPC1_6900003 [Methylocella tundrae]|nr:hypothetical protein MPC1_6900003 [Methylocella tundrae]